MSSTRKKHVFKQTNMREWNFNELATKILHERMNVTVFKDILEIQLFSVTTTVQLQLELLFSSVA